MAVFLDEPELDPHRHANLDILERAVHELRRDAPAAVHLADRHRVRRLVGKLRRRDVDDRVAQHFAGGGQRVGL